MKRLLVGEAYCLTGCGIKKSFVCLLSLCGRKIVAIQLPKNQYLHT
ncbi:MAG: hypothetical protein LBL39_01020 [Planctomycetaceae bacterium]|nr:hypothetical protein [Planctomycetaceae bacterium]